MISRPPAKKALKDFVVAELFTDKPPHGPDNRRLLSERFKTVALPLYVIIGPDGKERGRLAAMISETQFLEFLKQGLANTPEGASK